MTLTINEIVVPKVNFYSFIHISPRLSMGDMFSTSGCLKSGIGNFLHINERESKG